jgi:glucosamine-6-phosphate deaminase
MEVIIKDNYDEMSKQAAAIIAELVKNKPDCVLGLATGSTPVGTYQELIRLHKEEGLDFSKVTTFNLDEYVGLTPDHDQSYHYFMWENLFKDINVRKESVHLPPGKAEDIVAACQRYEDTIKAAGGLDIQVLGIGGNGHIAFNEPGSSLASRTRVKTLDERTIEDNARFFDSIDDVPRFAVTMGIGTILDARRLILLANKANKAAAVSAAVEGPVTASVPASAIQLHPGVTVVVEREAAASLKGDYGSEPAQLPG